MAKADTVSRLVDALRTAGVPAPEPEYYFAPRVDEKPVRRWRFDLCWPDQRIACEIDGSMFVGGRHGGQRSAIRDLEKRAVAAALGWRVIPVTPSQVRSGYAVVIVRAALGLGELPI